MIRRRLSASMTDKKNKKNQKIAYKTHKKIDYYICMYREYLVQCDTTVSDNYMQHVVS